MLQRVTAGVRTALKYGLLGLLGLALGLSLGLPWGLPWGSPWKGAAAQTTAPTSAPADFATLTANLAQRNGLFTAYSDLAAGKAYLALTPQQLDRSYLLVTTLASGLGEANLFRGRPISDFLIQFHALPDGRLQVIVPNTRIRSAERPSQQRLTDDSFSDSVIATLKVASLDSETGTRLVDLSDLLIKQDVADVGGGLGWGLSGYRRSSDLSRVDQLDVFPENLELGTTVGFVQDGLSADPWAALLGLSLRSLPDERGFSLRVRHSLSALPEDNGYRPRLADERVGYFTTVFRQPLQAQRPSDFVQYINRWNLQKRDASTELSPPVEPITFWLENTVPVEYREALRQGALMWNAAFEQAGFAGAIAVNQMPDSATWDPADVRYNVIRWADTLRPSFLGYGPSRVNPLTGEILDADIFIDASAVRSLQRSYQQAGLDLAADMPLCAERSRPWYLQWMALQAFGPEGLAQAREREVETVETLDHGCSALEGQQQVAFGALALAATPELLSQQDAYVQQYLAALTAHEIGHALGLRHNFAGSQLLLPEALNNRGVTQSQGLVSSVMDYFPPNVAPAGTEQGDFFPTRVGPYDQWAIEYGYRTLANGPLPERGALAEIAARSEAPELAYATDEDLYAFLDPEVSAWDLSSDPLQYATWQLDNARRVWGRLNRLSVQRGQGYGSLRQRVDLVFNYFLSNTMTLTSYVGGQRFRRLDPWTSRSAPLEPIAPDKQRQALATLNEQVFAADAFEFSPQLLNQLPPDRALHWGAPFTNTPLDYPIYERVLRVQTLALSDLMRASRLARVRDLEFKAPSDEGMTLAEMFDTLYQGIWGEIRRLDTVPNPSSLRRGLQQHHLELLSNLALRRSLSAAESAQSFSEFMALAVTQGAPDDARVLARYQLRQLYDDVDRALRRGSDMTVITQAYLEEVRDRVARILDAPSASG